VSVIVGRSPPSSSTAITPLSCCCWQSWSWFCRSRKSEVVMLMLEQAWLLKKFLFLKIENV
jgi:hypothetical protein